MQYSFNFYTSFVLLDYAHLSCHVAYVRSCFTCIHIEVILVKMCNHLIYLIFESQGFTIVVFDEIPVLGYSHIQAM